MSVRLPSLRIILKRMVFAAALLVSLLQVQAQETQRCHFPGNPPPPPPPPGVCDLGASINIVTPPAIDGYPTNAIYLGYGPQALKLQVALTGSLGNNGFQYQWSNGSTRSTLIVRPTTTTTYTVTVSKGGCSASATVTIYVADIRCGCNQVEVCDQFGYTHCVATCDVPSYIANGATLGSCEDYGGTTRLSANPAVVAPAKAIDVQLTPNPATAPFRLQVNAVAKTPYSYRLLDANGRVVETRSQLAVGQPVTVGANLQRGLYYIEVVQGKNREVVKAIRL